MQTLNLVQGSPEWLDRRAKHNTASEASVIMMASKKTSRDELLKVKATGDEKEISQWVIDNLFPEGHRIEAKARPIAEEIIGGELYPVTGIDDNGYLLSSFDGLTMNQDLIWECKQWNEEKAATVNKGQVPLEDYWQVVQQLVTSRASKCLYMVTDGTKEKSVYIWVALSKTDEAELMAGWKQFDEDLKNYEHIEVIPKAIAEPVLGLPAVSIKVDGAIALIDNLDVFGAALKEYIANINKKPETDQDFANLESAVKTLKTAEDALNSAENSALAQAESIDVMRRTVELYRYMARENRLITEKLVKAEKAARKYEIASNAEKERLEHQANLNQSLGGNYISISGDFNNAMKGKKTITSLQSAANDELARCKIEANALADKIRINLTLVPEEHKFLFSDLSQIITKENDDFKLLVDSRISEHKQKEQEKIDAAVEEAAKEKTETKEPTTSNTVAPHSTGIKEDAKPISRKERDANIDLVEAEVTKSMTDNGIGVKTAKKMTDLLITKSIKHVTINY